MNKTIMIFTAMSACLDQMKLIYVALLGFVVPIGMKVASMMHGATDSQTFEMLTGKVGVAFILMVLCLGLAGNTSTQGGRGGEYLPLVFTRPVSRADYVFTKWVTITVIGGTLAAVQNMIIAWAGFFFGESLTMQAIVSMIIERFLDAGIISAAMMLAMLNKNTLFQIVSIIAFYIWMAGQTIPPVSVAGPNPSGIDELALQSTKVMLSTSQLLSDLIIPTINVYDALNGNQLPLVPILSYVSTLCLYLLLAMSATNRREFFYGTN